MKACQIRCKGRCKQDIWVLSTKLDIEGFPGIYLCPCCGSKQVDNIIRPFTAIINISKEVKPGAITTLVSEAQQGQDIPVGQFHSVRRGDDESGEGSSEEQEQQASNDVVAPGQGPSRYEKEVCKYLGIPSDHGR